MRVLLLVGLLGSFGERLWRFALPLAVSLLWPGLLWPAAAVGLSETAASVLLGSAVGAVVDRRDRLQLMRVALVLQNGSIVGAAVCLLLMGRGAPFWPLFVALCVLAAVNSVAAQADSVCLKKVWLVVLYGGDGDMLGLANASLRRVDLGCEVAAPLLVGLLLYLPLSAALLFVVGLNVVSLVPEMLLLNALYRQLPPSHRKEGKEEEKQPEDEDVVEDGPLELEVKETAAGEETTAGEEVAAVAPAAPVASGLSLRDSFSAWPVYVRHAVFPCSLAYCFLFMTVLMPGSLMNSFLVAAGLPDLAISLFRGACAVTGMAATWLAAPLAARVGLERAGLVFSWAQWLALVPAVAVLFAGGGAQWSMYVFLAMVVVSRMGLWGFDLVEVQLLQTRVDQTQTGAVNAAEYSASQLLGAAPLVAALVLRETVFFRWLVLASAASVLVAALLFSLFVARQRRATIGAEYETVKSESE